MGGQGSRGDHPRVQPRRPLRRPRLVRAVEVHQVKTEAGPAIAFTNMTSEIKHDLRVNVFYFDPIFDPR